jgi:iron complex outermembrane recepter protein
MRTIVILVFALFCGVLVFAQVPGAIQGTIKTSDGNPAEYVSLSIEGSSKGTVADRNGHFEIKNLKPGRYNLVASFVGLQSQNLPVEVRNGEVTKIDFTIKANAQELEEIVISGSPDRYTTDRVSSTLRVTTPLLEIPQNIQVVTGEMLKDQQVISMSDGLIRNVSGAVRQEHWGDLYTNIAARGSQIQAFRNGFNVVNSYWGPLTEDMSFVDHIEFVKGPAGFMLSSGDPSGLYNVVTKKPTGISRREASISAGSFGLLRGSLDLDGKLTQSGKLLYRLNLSAQNKNSFRANEYNDRYVIAPVISYALGENTKVTIEYNYQRANMSNVGSFYIFSKEKFADLDPDFTMLPEGTPGVKINDHSLYANIQHNLTRNWKITGQASRFIYDQVGHSMWPSAVNQDGTIVRNVGIWDAKSEMTMGQLFVNGEARTGFVHHRILAGFDIAKKDYKADWGQSHDLDTRENPFDPTNPYLGVPVTGDPDFDRETPLADRAKAIGGLIDQQYESFYAQDELGFAENLIRLTLAGRYTKLRQSAWGADSDKANHFTPRAGLSVSITKQLSAYALYDQAFIPQTGKLASGAKVQPITGNNMEIGVKKEWFGSWRTTFAVYQIIKNNELTADPTDPLSGNSIELGQKKAKGFEFDLQGTIITGLNVIANYAFTDSRVVKVSEGVTVVEEGSIVPGFARHTVNTWLNYRFPRGIFKGFGASAGFTYLADRATYWTPAPDAEKEMENYFKLDGGLFWEHGKVKVTANVFNVLDTYLYSGSYENYMYDTEGNSSPVYSYQAEAPRNGRLSVAYKF